MSRQYFGTDGIRGQFGVHPITPDFALKLGWAAGKVFSKQAKQGPVLIGKDTRISGYLFESALEAGLIAAGVDVVQLGVMPTPAIAFLTRRWEARAGIVISASHNPYSDNGIKFFSNQGEKLLDEIELEIEALLDIRLETVSSEALGRASRQPHALEEYQEFCVGTIPRDTRLDHLQIVIDCAHGAAYQAAPKVFAALGANVEAIGVDPNGFNINDRQGSTAPEALIAAVKAFQADIGIAFDGDGDRLIMVDHTGEIVDGDEILFILANAYHRQNRLTGGVVGTQMSNLGLELGLRKMNIPFTRAKVGDRYVLEQLIQRGWNLGGEGSGHLICLDKTTTGDALIASLQVLAEMSFQKKSLHELKLAMQKFDQVLLNVPSVRGKAIVEAPSVQRALQESEAKLEGKGRILLRPSGTEPLVRVMVEGSDKEMILKVAKELADAVQGTERAS
ncbi:MAG: phosphoglucosamine mutase [Gammaproteobacteria bacterium]